MKILMQAGFKSGNARSGYKGLRLTCTASLLTILSVISVVFSAPTDPGQDEFLYARRLFDEKYYDLAAEQFERCLRDYPNIPNADDAQYYLAESRFLSNELEKARSAYLRTAILFPGSPRAPESLYKVALSLEKMNRLIEAAQAYERVQGFYPQDGYALDGLLRAIILYSASGDTVREEAITNLLLEKYPDSEKADAARLYKIERLIQRGDNKTARQYLEWIARRSANDSLAAVAWIKLSGFMRQNWELDAAEDALTEAGKRFPESSLSDQAALKLADILNYRGKTDAATELLRPLLKSTNEQTMASALDLTGDAWYKKEKFTQARAFFEKASVYDTSALLKAAWCSEKLNNRDDALKNYQNIISMNNEFTQIAMIRAAIIYGELGRWDEAFKIWSTIVSKKSFKDPSGRTYFEFIQAAAKSGRKPHIEPDLLLERYSDSQWLDEILYHLYITEYLPKNRTANPVQVHAAEFCQPVMASTFYDSAVAMEDYIQRQFIQNDKLVDLMATLSSRAPGSVSNAQWAVDWGRFYLNDFKDPVKALDQFTLALDDAKVTSDENIAALLGSIKAYLRLFEQAIQEQDTFASEMYSDSCLSYIQQYNRIAGSCPNEITLNFMKLDIERIRSNPENKLSNVTQNIIDKAISDNRFIPSISSHMLDLYIAKYSVDTSGLGLLFNNLDSLVTISEDLRRKSCLLISKIELLELLGMKNKSINTAFLIKDSYKNTPAGATALMYLVENDSLPILERLNYLHGYQDSYPYLVNSDTYQLEAELLDMDEKPLESLRAYEVGISAVNWGLPELNILLAPDPGQRIRTGKALFQAGNLERASDEIRSLLNLNPDGGLVPQALLLEARITYAQNNCITALAYLDSLKTRFGDSIPNGQAQHLRPQILMDIERYQPAYEDWKRLSLNSVDPDSQLYFDSRAIICLYRIGNLEEARIEAKDLYKKFEDSRNVDPLKAQFYLEKGMALDKIGEHEKARKQFEIIPESYPSTEWTDDASYAIAISYLSEKNVKDAVLALNRFIEDYPSSDLVPQALLTTGSIYYNEEKYPEAVSALKQLWENENVGNLRTETFRALITVYRDLRFWDAAIHLTREYLKQAPEAEETIDRRMDLGWYYLQLEEWGEAIRQYKSLLPLADAEREAEVQYYIGEAYFADGDYQSAILEFLKVKILGRKTKLDWGVTALYKCGLAYEKLGDKEGAARMYQRIIRERGETSNYGRTAKQRLDELK